MVITNELGDKHGPICREENGIHPCDCLIKANKLLFCSVFNLNPQGVVLYASVNHTVGGSKT